MCLKPRTIISALFIFFFLKASSQDITIQEQDEWIRPVSIPESSTVDTYDLKGGLFYSLFDTQINLDKEADYYHSVQNITGFAGVQSCSQLLIQFDPAYQKVHFHKLIIHRKGVKLDRTSELKFELLNNEGQLASSVYSGDLTAHAILTDIRRGDKVESSYTIYGDNPIFNGSYFRFLPLNDFIPIDKLNLDIFTEHPSKLKYKLDKASINDLTVTKEKKKLHLNYSKSNIEACEYEESMAYTELPMANLIVHSMDSWNEVQEWSQEVFKVEGNTTILEKLSPSLDESLSMKKQIDQAIKFVQDEIRYMSINSGIGSHKPRPPIEVLEDRFGDCKDKSLLLSELLKEIGVKSATPALVSVAFLDKVSELPPAGNLFDHCIVNFEYEGVKYWVDPTISNHGGSFLQNDFCPYKFALLINSKNATATVSNENKYATTEVYEYLDVSNFKDTSQLDVLVKYGGTISAQSRALMDLYSLKELADFDLAYYGNKYPYIQERERIRIEDDLDSNELTIYEYYDILRLWSERPSYTGNVYEFVYEPISIYEIISPMLCEEKTYSVNVPYPTNYYQRTEIKLPELLIHNKDELIIDNPAFTYKYSSRMEDSLTLVLEYSFVSKTDVITPMEFQKVCSDISVIFSQITRTFTYPKPSAFLNGTEERKTFQQLIDEGVIVMPPPPEKD